MREERRTLTEDEFWDAIATTVVDPAPKPAPAGVRLGRLERHLQQRSLTDLVDFQRWMDHTRRRVDTYDHWAAAEVIFGVHVSGDSFFYFCAWLIGLGRDQFDAVADDPDALADAPEVRRLRGSSADWTDDEFPGLEELAYVAPRVHEARTGIADSLDDALRAQGCLPLSDPAPSGTPWDPTEPALRRTRLPRLGTRFPVPESEDRGRLPAHMLARYRAETGENESG
ncbi:DUF4240 domain-containing protein [Dactylosporangium sp. AC04546]|uniref:DUF4240 domain-containing protein n=1 Tax=Dactylosporangium sp. AC04546 TaxID=2862460 RepID=UPI001EDE7F48|nr:DUF4240 domain-containing protein [Dactylosporangium sp. AC04546]WVK79426.1 DUF4240 domain-containing protein [Dactylosporangium sp. AC04546]